VYIHPKILDGFGEGMSKSKGNGVDPLDVIEKFGADALRFSLAYLTTDTQDVRMPVEFECPHCHALIEQTKKNRVQPRIDCKKCGQPFGTQWASTPVDRALARGAVVGERFELGRNFCNKLWNAARFALLNLGGYSPGSVGGDELAVEDRWILSRLATVTAQTTEALEGYHFGDAARTLYDFAWNEFCSFYVEMTKGRLQNPATRGIAQRVLAHVLDTLARLLHPMIPFLSEEIWQQLAQVAPARGLSSPEPAAESIMIARWPRVDTTFQDWRIEARFARFQEVLEGLRKVRSQHNIAPKTPMRFAVRCDRATAELLQPMEPYFSSMAGATATAWDAALALPANSASFVAANAEVFVDLAEHLDIPAEIARKTKELSRLESAITGKQSQLANANFVQRAPAAVIEKERASLAQLEDERAATQAALAALTVGPK
jgi:valyl-tRNA synthetase